MLKGISPIISPELLKIIAEMGHGDELVIGDSNFPAQSMGKRGIRADGHSGADILDAFDSDHVGVDVEAERKGGEDADLSAGVVAVDVGRGVGFSVAEGLRFLERILKRETRFDHAREDVVGRAV